MAKDDNSKDLRIKTVPPDVKRDLTNIAKNMGITLSGFLKPKLRDIANSFPPELKEPPRAD